MPGKVFEEFSTASQSKRPFRALHRGMIAFGEDNLPVPIHGRHRGDHPAGTGPAACAKTARASAPPTPVLELTITQARRVTATRRLMSVLATTRGAGITDRMSPTPGWSRIITEQTSGRQALNLRPLDQDSILIGFDVTDSRKAFRRLRLSTCPHDHQRTSGFR